MSALRQPDLVREGLADLERQLNMHLRFRDAETAEVARIIEANRKVIAAGTDESRAKLLLTCGCGKSFFPVPDGRHTFCPACGEPHDIPLEAREEA